MGVRKGNMTKERHNIMRKTFVIATAVAAFALYAATFAALAADDPGYICTMHVGSSTADQSVSKDTGSKKSGGRRTTKSVSTKTTTSSLSWPVTVSINGKSLPASGSVKLKCHFIGTTDGHTEFLGERTIPVEIDEKGVFKTVVTSPPVKLVRTKTTTKTRASRRRSGGTSVKSEMSGSRVTGCIIQLIVNGKVERAFASSSSWTRHAKKSPLLEDDILKGR